METKQTRILIRDDWREEGGKIVENGEIRGEIKFAPPGRTNGVLTDSFFRISSRIEYRCRPVQSIE